MMSVFPGQIVGNMLQPLYLQPEASRHPQGFTSQFTFQRVREIGHRPYTHDFVGTSLHDCPCLCAFEHPSAVVTNTCS